MRATLGSVNIPEPIKIKYPANAAQITAKSAGKIWLVFFVFIIVFPEKKMSLLSTFHSEFPYLTSSLLSGYFIE